MIWSIYKPPHPVSRDIADMILSKHKDSEEVRVTATSVDGGWKIDALCLKHNLWADEDGYCPQCWEEL